MNNFEDLCIDLNITDIENLLKSLSNNNIKWNKNIIDNNNILYQLYNNWNIKLDINNNKRYLNNIIINNNLEIIFNGGPKIYDSIRDNFTFNDIKDSLNLNNLEVYRLYEGTTINIFYYCNKWYYTTKKKLDMYNSYFNSIKSHGEMFNDIIDKLLLEEYLNKTYKYTFILVHTDNSHILNDSNKLVLINIKDSLHNHINDYTHLNDLINNNTITIPQKIDINNIINNNIFNNNPDYQGIIIYNNDNIYKIYANKYTDLLKSKPRFHTYQEYLIFLYINNLLNNNSLEYNLINNIIYHISNILLKFVRYFTIFHINNKIKFSHYNSQDYYILSNYNILKKYIYIIQRLPYKTNNDITLNNVINIINKSSSSDIMYLYKILLLNNNLSQFINYNKNKIKIYIHKLNNL